MNILAITVYQVHMLPKMYVRIDNEMTAFDDRSDDRSA